MRVELIKITGALPVSEPASLKTSDAVIATWPVPAPAIVPVALLLNVEPQPPQNVKASDLVSATLTMPLLVKVPLCRYVVVSLMLTVPVVALVIAPLN